MTGLETAIILIAFVTVALVLAYSVLSAGIFSAERGEAIVYAGLRQAQSTLEVKGSMIGITTDNTSLSSIEFFLGLTIPDERLDKNAIVFNYFDSTNTTEGITPTSFTLGAGSIERGAANFIENDELFRVILPISNAPTAYETINIQIIPPTGATLTLRRVMPGALEPVIDLK